MRNQSNLFWVLALGAVAGGCASEDGAAPTGTGGLPVTGGTATGGGYATGGDLGSGGMATGGTFAPGGAPATGGSFTTGGAIATGGSSETGGASPTGGMSTGGELPTGGTTTGGASTGGTSTGGASTGGTSTGGTSTGGTSTGGTSTGGTSSFVIEEGDGFCSVTGAVESENAGFSGAGYANTSNAAGTSVVWAIDSTSAQTVTLTWTFANGGTVARSATVYVNDVAAGTVTLAATAGDWVTWQTVSTTVALVAGNNVIELEAISSEGLANIDSLTVSPDDVAAGACPQVVDPSWTVDGFAATDGGTTGGGNAAPTTVTTCAALKTALEASGPAVVQLPSGTVLDCRLNPSTATACRIACTGSNDVTSYIDRVPVTGQTCADLGGVAETNAITRYDYSINVASNKTLVGLGEGATIRGASINISNVSNVIVQNIALKDINAALIEAGDGLTINGSDHVFINHCEFSMISDGYMDIRYDSTAITVSYNVMNGVAADHHDCSGQHNFISMVAEASRVTYHHNYFYHCGGRNPKVGGTSNVHIYNNYYDTISYFCANSSESSQILVQNNYYYNARYPHWADGGLVEASGNVYAGTTTASGTGRDSNGDAFTPPYTYAPESAAALNTTVPQQAGLGTLP